MQSNKEWAQKILDRIDPAFKHRWEVYTNTIQKLLNTNSVWIDCGCGSNGLVESYGHLAKEAYGVDVAGPEKNISNFIKADIKRLPFSSEFADLVTLRFVVEHFDYPELYFSEIRRVLKRNGKVLIITTNLLCPIIFIPKIVFPYPLKSLIISKLYKVDTKDIFPTYHRINTQRQYKRLNKGLSFFSIEYLSDLNYSRKWIFLPLLSWHLLTRFLKLEYLRTNLLVTLRKNLTYSVIVNL